MVGRGIRTKSDKCIVSVLDERFASASYRMKIYKSFPYKKTTTRKLEDVRIFLGKPIGQIESVANVDPTPRLYPEFKEEDLPF
jgi:hypothetical protein